MINELMSGIDIILPMMEWFWKGMLNIGISTTCVIVSYNLNHSLHEDIFPKRQWKFTSEVDGLEYTLEEG